MLLQLGGIVELLSLKIANLLSDILTCVGHCCSLVVSVSITSCSRDSALQSTYFVVALTAVCNHESVHEISLHVRFCPE